MTSAAHPLRPERGDELTELVAASPWFVRVLEAAADVAAPNCWVGAGVVRDLVWDTRFGDGFHPDHVKDVDVVFFDPTDLRPERDQEIEEALVRRDGRVPWEAKNQAAVHTWYARRFGIEVEPLSSSLDAIATWPEFATAVGVRLDRVGRVEVAAPYGLDDLLDGVLRRNPRRVTLEEYRRRLERKQPHLRWPRLRAIVDEPDAS
ncbi:MAG: nucleotidyltransferase family protein [Acidimicrobiia bacterium]